MIRLARLPFLSLFLFLLAGAGSHGQEKNSPYIQDQAGIISAFFEEKIAAEAESFEKKTSIRIHILTRSFKELTSFSREAENYFLAWLSGLKNGKKGVLFFLGLKEDSTDGRINLRVGMGLKEVVSEAELNTVLGLVLKKNLVDQDGEGLLDGVQLLEKTLLTNLAQRKEAPPPPPRGLLATLGDWISTPVFYGFILACIALFFFILALTGEKCPLCGYRLQVTIEEARSETELEHGFKKKLYRCANCGWKRYKKEILVTRGSPSPALVEDLASGDLQPEKKEGTRG